MVVGWILYLKQQDLDGYGLGLLIIEQESLVGEFLLVFFNHVLWVSHVNREVIDLRISVEQLEVLVNEGAESVVELWTGVVAAFYNRVWYELL